MKNPSVRARSVKQSAVKNTPVKTAAPAPRATQKAVPKSKLKAESQSVPPPKVSKPVASKTTKTVAKSVSKSSVKAKQSTPAAAPKAAAKKSAPATVKKPLVGAKKVAAPKTATEKVPAKSASTPLRATKKRAPKDLALQYGEKVKEKRVVVDKPAPRKRRNAATRAKLQQVIAPDEGVLQRLARAGAISSSLAPELSSGSFKSLRSGSTRRSRKWEAHCGKCGTSAQYSAAAALCVKCGTILVRE